MYLSETKQEKWEAVMNHPDVPEITDPYKRDVTMALLENQEKFLKEAAPTQSWNASDANTLPIKGWDPILISMVRRSMPMLMAYDVMGVQPMSGPTGLIFAMRAHYTNQTGAEAWGATGTGADEVDTTHSGEGTHTAISNTVNPFTDPANTTGTAVDSHGDAGMEGFGSTGGGTFNEMAFTIDKTSVIAESRALKAEYSTELAQDLKAVHGMDAETELSNILSTEILAEINREVIRRIYSKARYGGKLNATAGTGGSGAFDVDADSDGRWSIEKYKGLMMQIEQDRNEIGHETRRGRGNFLICSANVASALSMSGMLETPTHPVNVDDTKSTLAGSMNGMKVYVDPYYTTGAGQIYVVGYKGTSAYDAGMFYCPYVPLQMVRAMGEDTFQPKIGFKTRYGMTDNPFVTTTAGIGWDEGTSAMTGNEYYRKVGVTNLL